VHPLSPSRALRAITASLVAATLLVAGCGTTIDEPLPSGSPPGAAGGTTMHVLGVAEAKASGDGGPLFVVGLLIDDGSGWRLCEMVLESYPPQCGGEFLRVEGLDHTALPLQEASGVRWQVDATVVGEVDGDVLTVTGSPASS